jgi:hypothetical protein
MAGEFQLDQIWIAPEWEQSLATAGLLDIEALTLREFDWFESPNKRLGGWSGVTRLCLNPTAVKEEQDWVFLKIQQNHCYRTLGTGFKKRLTFEREMDGFEALKGLNLLPDLLLFAKWHIGKNVGSLLVTHELPDFLSFEDWIQSTLATNPEPEAAIRKALCAVADGTRAMHQAGLAHFACKPKHVYLSIESEPTHQIRLIDLERSRRPLTKKTFVTEDLSRFLRHSLYLTLEQKIQFLKDYFETESFSPKQQRWVDQLRKDKSLRPGEKVD